MIISGMNVHDLYNYSRIQGLRPEAIKPETASKDNSAVSSVEQATETIDYSKRTTLPTKEVTDFAIQEMNTDKGLIGSNSDIESLDVKRAVSEMQQDSMIHQYQYFVGNVNDEDGRVIRKDISL